MLRLCPGACKCLALENCHVRWLSSGEGSRLLLKQVLASTAIQLFKIEHQHVRNHYTQGYGDNDTNCCKAFEQLLCRISGYSFFRNICQCILSSLPTPERQSNIYRTVSPTPQTILLPLHSHHSPPSPSFHSAHFPTFPSH